MGLFGLQAGDQGRLGRVARESSRVLESRRAARVCAKMERMSARSRRPMSWTGGLGLAVRWAKASGSTLRPVAPDDLGDGEERAPVVRQAVEGAGRQGPVSGGEGGEIIFGPAGEFAGEGFFNVGILFVEAGSEFALIGFN